MPAAKRPTRCSICNHRELAALNLAIARGVSAYALANRYGVSSDAVYRHAKRPNCLPPQLRAKLLAGPSIEGVDLDKLKHTESQSILSNLIALRHRLFAALETAEEAGDSGMLARVAGQLHHNLELTGKLLGDLGVGSTTINNVLLVPAYVNMRVELVKALQPFPDARVAVAAVLAQLEGDAAKVIEADDRTLATGRVA